MPTFKDHLHAFKLSCQQVREDYPHLILPGEEACTGKLKDFYRQGFLDHLDILLLELELDIDMRLGHTNLPRTFDADVDAMVPAYLRDLFVTLSERHHAGDYKEKAILDSRSEQEACRNTAKKMGFDWSKAERTAEEHDAYDMGTYTADHIFITVIMPDLINEYQQKFDPREHPYPRDKFEAPRYLM